MDNAKLTRAVLTGVFAMTVMGVVSLSASTASAATPSLYEEYQAQQKAENEQRAQTDSAISQHNKKVAEAQAEESKQEGATDFTERIRKILADYGHTMPNEVADTAKEAEDNPVKDGKKPIATTHDASLPNQIEDITKEPAGEKNVSSDSAPATNPAPAPQPVAAPPQPSLGESKYNFNWRGTPLPQSLYALSSVAHRGLVLNSEVSSSKVYANLQQVTVNQALDYLSRAFNFNWMLDGDNIIISKNDIMLQSATLKVKHIGSDKAVEELKALGIDSGHIYADPDTRTISVTTTPYLLSEARKRMDTIDHPVAQCLLVAQFISVSHGKDVNLGFSYTLPSYSHTGSSESSGGTSGNGESSNSSLKGNFLEKLTFGVSTTASRALNKGKVISRPMVLSRNGQKASVIFGDRVPIMNSTSTNSATNITVTYQTVGTTLTITPVINEDSGEISLDIAGEVSNITAWQSNGGGTRAPQIATRNITTSTHVHSGQSFVIGGLMSQSDLDNLSGIPGLMNLPVLGRLFSTHTHTKTFDEVFIMITPYIVTDNLDAKKVLREVKE